MGMVSSRCHPDPWPAGPKVPLPVLATMFWSDAVFLHWRVPESAVRRFLPPHVEPDVVGGSTWVGLIGFRLHGTKIGGRVRVPWLGDFTEVNVRLYTRGADGSRGVFFLSLDASRLPAVLAARSVGVPYIWSRCRPLVSGPGAGGTKVGGTKVGGAAVYGYDVERFRGQAQSAFTVEPDFGRQAEDGLSQDLTARFGAHARVAGRTVFIPVSHRPWALYPARLATLDDGLLAAAGVPVSGPPETVHFSPGVRSVFGRPHILF